MTKSAAMSIDGYLLTLTKTPLRRGFSYVKKIPLLAVSGLS